MGEKYGVDVAKIRVDDLDKKMLEYVRTHNVPYQEVCSVQESSDDSCSEVLAMVSVLDLGCGGGGQSGRLATSGALVLGVDVGAYGEVFDTIRQEQMLSVKQLDFIQGNITQLATIINGEKFDICCFQRAIHYMSYDVALEVLTYLRTQIIDKLYISVTGLESDIGMHYADGEKPVSERFTTLNKEDTSTFHIGEPICLYTPEEFIVLLQKSGWKIGECWVSAFGNIKVICY